MPFSNYLTRKLGTEAGDPMLDYIYDLYSTSAGQIVRLMMSAALYDRLVIKC